MNARWGWLLACLVLSAAARAEAKPAVRDAGVKPRPAAFSAPPEVPAGGVLPFFGNCNSNVECATLAAITVTDVATNTLVEGRIELVRVDIYAGFAYFVPNAPFVAGSSYDLKLQTQYDDNVVRVDIVEPDSLDAGAVSELAELSNLREVQSSRCCPTWNLNAPERCLDVSVFNSAMLSVRLTAQLPAASQYTFQLSVRPVDQTHDVSGSEFGSVWDPTWASSFSQVFVGSAASYCYSVRARPIVGGDPVLLKTACVDNKLEDLGAHERTHEEVERWLGTCEPRPANFDDSALAEDDLSSDEPASDKPRDGADASVGADDEDDRAARRGQEGGCQLAGGGTPAAGVWWWCLALALTKRKRPG